MANEFKKYELVFLTPGIYPERIDNPINVIGWHEGPSSRVVQWENGCWNTYDQGELILPTDEEIAKYFRKKYPEGCIVAFNDGQSFKVEYDHPIRVRREADKIFVDYYGSESYLYHNGTFATIIKKAEVTNTSEVTSPSKLTREQLLEMFPPGTEFIPYRNGERHPNVTVRKSWVLYSNGSGTHWFKDVRGDSAHIGYVCDGGNLATIVKKAEEPEDVMRELHIKFPAGKRFRPIEASGDRYADIYTVEGDWFISRNDIGYYFSDPGNVSPHRGYIRLYTGKQALVVANAGVDNAPMDELPMSPLEIVKANFPPGTVFIPEEGTREEVIVQKDWTLNIGNRGSIWFRDELRSSVHDGFLYLARTETYAKIVTPGKVPQLENEPAQVFAAIDRPLIVPKTIPTTGPNVPVIVSIPTLLKTKKKSKLISNQ
jgi:hypothetical protein